jgi:multiple sugar transport system ATP-binding protein
VGAPLELYRSPRNLFVAGFIGSPRMNFIKGQVLRAEGNSITIGFAGTEATLDVRPSSVKTGDHVTVGIRPEHMEAGGTDSTSLRGIIDAVEQLGESSYVYMRLASGDDVIVRAPGETEASPGGDYTAHVPTRALHVFDAAGLSVLAGRD